MEVSLAVSLTIQNRQEQASEAHSGQVDIEVPMGYSSVVVQSLNG